MRGAAHLASTGGGWERACAIEARSKRPGNTLLSGALAIRWAAQRRWQWSAARAWILRATGSGRSLT